MKKHRPMGVWILTAFALVFGGLFPLYFEPFDLLRGYFAFYAPADIPVIVMTAMLNVLIIAASILTWMGSRIGRISFLIFIAILFWQDGIDVFLWGTRIPTNLDNWFRYITDFGFPLVCIWYFNRPSTREFFGTLEKNVVAR